MNYFTSKTVKEWKWVNMKKNFIRRWADLTFDMRTFAKYTVGLTIMFLHVLTAFLVSIFMFTVGNIFVFICNKTAPFLNGFVKKIFNIIYK